LQEHYHDPESTGAERRSPNISRRCPRDAVRGSASASRWSIRGDYFLLFTDTRRWSQELSFNNYLARGVRPNL